MKIKVSPRLLQVSIGFLVGVTLLFSTIGVQPARAATTWTVTSLADDGNSATGTCPDASQCRLRRALSLAGDGDTIVFDAALSGQTIYLAGTLTISTSVIIDGSTLASPITISGDSNNDNTGDVQIMIVNTGITTTLDSLILNRGKASASGGGAILNNGTLIVDNTDITKSTATNGGGGIVNFGTLTVTDGLFSENSTDAGGGAIYNADDSTTITNSIFNSNTANVGGAIYSIDTLDVTGSTFVGNGTIFAGGAINTSGNTTIKNTTFNSNSAGTKGGAISTTSSTYITNSTFVSNSATTKGGGIYTWVTGIAINNSTFSGNWSPNNNGGGIYNDGSMQLTNTIIANSVAGGDCKNGSGNTSINVNNLIEDGSCGAALSGDPKLGVLANNGGPTQTMALMGGSPAINAADDAACAAAPVSNLDQRGVTRPIGGHCDIGAFESRFTSVTYISNGAQDGWVLESSETSNQGQTINSTNTVFYLGDDRANRQYRGILSFNTSSLPDTAAIASILLKINQHGPGDDVSLVTKGLTIDVKTGPFGAVALQSADFQTAGTATYTSSWTIDASGPSGWHTINLTNAKNIINKLTSGGGLTQIRVYFKADDNNNNIANYISFSSGNDTAASRPQLVIQYYVP